MRVGATPDLRAMGLGSLSILLLLLLGLVQACLSVYACRGEDVGAIRMTAMMQERGRT